MGWTAPPHTHFIIFFWKTQFSIEFSFQFLLKKQTFLLKFHLNFLLKKTTFSIEFSLEFCTWKKNKKRLNFCSFQVAIEKIKCDWFFQVRMLYSPSRQWTRFLCRDLERSLLPLIQSRMRDNHQSRASARKIEQDCKNRRCAQWSVVGQSICNAAHGLQWSHSWMIRAGLRLISR